MLQTGAALAQDGPQRCGELPPAVAERRDAILAAAQGGSLEALAGLTAADFTASYGGGEPLELWREWAAQGTDIRAVARTLLAVDCTVEHADDLAYFTWPAANDLPWDALTEEERTILAVLYGGDMESAYVEGHALGYYVGWAMTITGNGDWIALVAGD